MEDVGPRPSKLHTLERIDNNGDYEPGNVRWATRAEQMRNTRANRNITFSGETMCLMDWAKRLGVSCSAMRGRFRRRWSIEKALTTPPDLTKAHRALPKPPPPGDQPLGN